MEKSDRDLFEREIEKAVDVIPERFRETLGNVAILLEDSSSSVTPESPGPEPGDIRDPDAHGLLGLYEGVPTVEYAGDPTGILPPTLTLFMEEIVAEANEAHDGDVSRVIRETIWHEFAHALGFDEDGAHRLECKWEERWRERYGKGA